MFKFDVLELDKKLEVVLKTKEKTYYGLGKSLLSKWVRRVKVKNIVDAPKLSSPLTISTKGNHKIGKNSLGYLLFDSNNPSKSQTKVALFSSTFSNGQGISVVPENMLDITTAFSVRKIVKPDWLNWYDEYLSPNEEHEQFEQFKYDSLVYSLFESKSNQSSLRQIEYKDKLWDIKNEFFWMSADRMKKLGDDNGYDNLYNDALTASDRHVYKILFGEERIYDKLSDDARKVLDKATEMVENSIQMRQKMANDENHLNSWDAGYAQLKLVWKEYFEEDFKEFRKLYKEMEDRMRPLVYELGFLMK